jgi:hypothetical protein
MIVSNARFSSRPTRPKKKKTVTMISAKRTIRREAQRLFAERRIVGATREIGQDVRRDVASDIGEGGEYV